MDTRNKGFLTCVDSNTTSTVFTCTCVEDHNTMFSRQNDVYYCRAPSYLGCQYSLLESQQTFLVNQSGGGVHKIYPNCSNWTQPPKINIYVWNSKRANVARWWNITEQGSPFFEVRNGELHVRNIDMTQWAGHVIRIDFGQDVADFGQNVGCLTLKFNGKMNYPYDVERFKKGIRTPIVTTAKPVVTTVKPIITTAKPVVTTVKPVITTFKPAGTTATKTTVVTTKKYDTTTKKPDTPFKPTSKQKSTKERQVTTIKPFTQRNSTTRQKPKSVTRSLATTHSLPETSAPKKRGKSKALMTTLTIAGGIALATLFGVGILLYRCKKQVSYKYKANVQHKVGEDGVTTTMRDVAHSFFNPNYEREFLDSSEPTY